LVGAEGLTCKDGEFCALADDPAAFADRVVTLFDNPEEAAKLAARARAEVEANWDIAVMTGKLVESYRELVKEKRQ
jgi:glycosyltransferase involved in cell wall biosynthesis